MIKKTPLQSLWDFLGIPFRMMLFDQRWLPHFGWTTLEEERLSVVFPHLHGYVLDVGAGTNTLINSYGNGIGVDVFDWGGGTLMVEDSSRLPFEDASFDTISFIACLNHIPYREAALREARRLVKPGGRLIVTMINPILGEIGHAIWWHGEDKHRGGMKEGEVGGLWTRDVVCLCKNAGFALELHQRFGYGLNNLYVFKVE